MHPLDPGTCNALVKQGDAGSRAHGIEFLLLILMKKTPTSKAGYLTSDLNDGQKQNHSTDPSPNEERVFSLTWRD